MPQHITERYISLPVLALMLVLEGCGTTPPSRFYTLESIAQTTEKPAASEDSGNVHIGVGPVQFAEYLDRTQIVTRTDNTEVNLSETHRWAEPLQANFTRILAENLSVLLNTDRVSLHPSRNWSEVDYQVLVNVWQFDVSKQGQANLVANWSIRGKGGANLVTMQKTVLSTEVEPEASYAEAARALSKTVEMFSHIIADAISKNRQS
jgi:uncharacterized lipoprotein YmbA